ncbi:MAG: TIGR02302 family protein [Methyloceanibacter sp.]|jgi:uncharacterized protein (TIGR02302 family)|nr:TIGR02302 family protein [Methyloceanibacter sp.]
MARRSRPRFTAKETAEAKALKKRFEGRVRLSWLALLAERAWEALLWPFVVVSAFLIITLLSGWSMMPPLMHRILLGAFGVAFIVSFLPLVRLVFPTRIESLRRLERNADIEHRPASSYEDQLGTTAAPETATLWAAHRKRLAKLVARLKPSWPAPRTDRKDPYAIRVLLLLGLIVAALAAGADSRTRLAAAFSPATGSTTNALLRLDAWVTPPIYTSMAPIVLADGSETVGAGSETFRALSVPERSQLIVRTHVPDGDSVSLTIRKGSTAEPKTIEPKTGGATGLIEFNVGVMEPLTADVRIGGQTVAQWQFSLIEDASPTIALTSDPNTTPRGALRLLYSALDDYGVASAEAQFALAAGEDQAFVPPAPGEEVGEDDLVEANPLFTPPVMPLQLPQTNAKKVKGRATQDLSAHPWAGLKVRMTLIARDQAEQAGKSQVYEFALPERTFTEPLAKAVVEQRKKLVREPAALATVARAIDALTLGEERVIDDRVVYLSLRNSYWRLLNDDSRDSVASVVDQLWATALRIEEGDLPEAERELKNAQDALKKALADNAPADEIQRRVDELRAALGRYLQALAEQQQDAADMPQQEAKDGEQLVSEQDLDKLLESIQDLSEAGSKEQAERMLSELNDILERLQTGNLPKNAKQKRANEMMKDLDDVVSDQQKLLDDTFEEKRQRQGKGGGGDQFKVSPPNQSMDFGQGMGKAPFQDQLPQSGQSGAKAQGQSGRQGNAPGDGETQRGQQQSQRQGELAKRQKKLRDKLQQLMERMRAEGGDASKEFGGAEEAMEDAEEALADRDLESATQNQSLALDRMRKGSQAMAQEMMENGEMQAGRGPGSNGRDPLGRPDRSNRPDLGLSSQVPDKIDIQRAREVLDELRRRIGDPSRTTLELDYLERLIRSF